MKLWLGISLALLALGQTHGSIFERTFKRIHEEPPLPTTQNRADVVQTLWIEQKLDHFDPAETRTWQMVYCIIWIDTNREVFLDMYNVCINFLQRYMLNDALYQSGAPLFIYLGGEWEISSGRITGGHLYDMAKEHNALLAYTEHRYYGQSKPLP